MHDSYTSGPVILDRPNIVAVKAAPVAGDVARSRDHWLELAQSGERLVDYFSIYRRYETGNKLVGQIFLHDYDEVKHASLVGYHLFQPEFRGQGTGTIALRLLMQYVSTVTSIQCLSIITDQENHASQRVAEKCGFVYRGPAREGLPLIRYEWLRLPRK